jgi:hypothetical protein
MSMKRSTLRSMIVSAMMTALAITLPMAFHAVGLGSKFLPMSLPLLLNGFLSSWPWAILAAVAAPWLSAALTGMPPIYPPVALVMSCEGVVLAGVASVLYRATRRRMWPALLCAIVLSRAVSVLLTWFFVAKFHLPGALAAGAVLVEGLPGAALQVILIPLALKGLQRRRSLLFGDED